MKINFKIVAVTGLVFFIAMAVYIKIRQSRIILQGETVVRQLSVSPRIAGRIEEVFVKEGDYVEKGQIIAKIDSPDIIAKAHQAISAARAAHAQRQKAYKGTRVEDIASAHSVWQKAIVGATLAEKTYKRTKELYEGGVISAQKLDEAEANYNAAVEDRDNAKSRYDMALNGARAEDKDSASAISEQAKGVVAEIESYVKETTLTAPKAGEISSVVVEQGELVAPGLPVVTLLDLTDVWITFNVREDLLKYIKMNEIIEVKIPAVDEKKHTFRVTYISKQGDYALWSATKTRGEFDLKTFEVRAVPVDDALPLRHGMTALLRLSK